MSVKCPVCQTKYELEPGKYKCECGAKFWVTADGGVSLADPDTAANYRTSKVDPERTMAPKTTHDKNDDPSFDPDRTVANLRVRREHGELQVGDIILNRYELLEKLGSGAMGMVFKCRDQVSQVEYALKMVPPELARDAEAMEEVRENFQLVHGLKHPNIASMDFLDRDEYGAYFLIMEYAKGESLAQWIRKKWKSGRPTLREVANIVRQIASALDYAHGQQILHRDIKPANIMVDEHGNVKVLDFGLASKVRSTMTALSVNQANSSGTPNYLSPEQFKGKYPGPASDQYALGVLTYQMFAGHLPFDSDDFNVLRAAVSSETPDRIDDLPDTINRCLLKVLNKNPKERYARCGEFAEALPIIPAAVPNVYKESQGEPRKVSKTEPTPTVGIQQPKRMEQKKNPDDQSEKKTDIPPEKPTAETQVVLTDSGDMVLLPPENQNIPKKKDTGWLGCFRNVVKWTSIILLGIIVCLLIFLSFQKILQRAKFADNGKTLQRVPEALGSFDIPNGVTHIEHSAFSSNKSLKHITIPNSVTYIGNDAFIFCESLDNIIIPDSVTYIGNSAFRYCKSLKNIKLPAHIKHISIQTFSGCSALKNITIPSSVTRFDFGAFEGCSSLESIAIPPGQVIIGRDTFCLCKSLNSITIPSGVTSIQRGAFACCTALKHVTIPDTVTYIGSRAFEECHSLKSITLPNKEIKIEKDTFYKAACEEQVKRDYPHLFK